jgi:tetratricopeptide (TPR) repeat protein
MSSIEKDLDKIVALAERSQDESAFQNHLQYKKFKARYQNQVVQSPTYFGNMYRVLRSKKFYNEHVFWGMKILENQQLGNKEDRAYTLYLIVNSFYNLNDYENVLKYGEKALEHEIQPNELTDTKAKRRFLEVMQETSLLFQKKRDAMEHAKEILKLDVIRCNKKEFEKFYLLQSYYNLIELQIANGDFKSAQKTIDICQFSTSTQWTMMR